MFFILLLFFSLLFDVIPHPSVDYCRGFYTPFYTFSPAHCRVIHDTFIFSTIPSCRERYGLAWAFFTHRRFLPYAPLLIFQPAFIKASLGAGSSFLKFSGLHTDPQNTDPAHLFVLIHSNPQTFFFFFFCDLFLYFSLPFHLNVI